MHVRQFYFIGSLLCGLLILSGCFHPPKGPGRELTGDPIQDGYNAISQGPNRDQNLWRYRTALTAMRLGRFEDAKSLLDEAIAFMQSARFDAGKDAAKSRRMFHSESGKAFIGEPYERAMAYYYRGILYWMDGEPDNARACFRSAQLEDSDSEEGDYKGDYALFELLDEWITRDLRGQGGETFERASKLSRYRTAPTWREADNVFVFVDMGYGPRKYAGGDYNEKLKFLEGRSRAQSARISIGPLTKVTGPMDNISFQATTRGGRVMDHILGNKAVFKEGVDTVGNAAVLSGIILGQNKNTQELGLGLAAAGIVAKILASQTMTRADTRMWDNLPQWIAFDAFEVPTGHHQILIEFLDKDGRPIPEFAKKAAFNVDSAGRDVVIYASDR